MSIMYVFTITAIRVIAPNASILQILIRKENSKI